MDTVKDVALSLEYFLTKAYRLEVGQCRSVLGGIISADDIERNLFQAMAIGFAKYYAMADIYKKEDINKFMSANSSYFNKSISEIGIEKSDSLVKSYKAIMATLDPYLRSDY